VRASISKSLPLILFLTGFSWAETIYDVSLDTSPLIGHPAGPFALEFQFNDGSGTGDANNVISISNFSLSGGKLTGPPQANGGASGDLSSLVTMTDSSFFNQYVEAFTPGTLMNFRLQITANVDSGGTPDEFSMSILDNSGSEIPTLGRGASLLIIDINSSNPIPSAFASDTTRSPHAGGFPISLSAPVVTEVGTSVPEPANCCLFGFVMLMLMWLSRNHSQNLTRWAAQKAASPFVTRRSQRLATGDTEP